MLIVPLFSILHRTLQCFPATIWTIFQQLDFCFYTLHSVHQKHQLQEPPKLSDHFRQARKSKSKTNLINMHFSKSLVAMLASASVGSMHMIMKTPVPFGKDSLNNSPLDASGSDYPCKQRPGVYDKGSADNKMAIGQPQTLSFTGSATHVSFFPLP